MCCGNKSAMQCNGGPVFKVLLWMLKVCYDPILMVGGLVMSWLVGYVIRLSEMVV